RTWRSSRPSTSPIPMTPRSARRSPRCRPATSRSTPRSRRKSPRRPRSPCPTAPASQPQPADAAGNLPMCRHNVDLLAYHDLDGRSGLKLALQEAGGRFILYVAGFWHSGWSILEVTDPEHPQLLRWLPGPPGTMIIQVQVADGIMITALEHPRPEEAAMNYRRFACPGPRPNETRPGRAAGRTAPATRDRAVR